MDTLLLAGASEVEITPAPGLPMDGYMGRVSPSSGAHDPLVAQVLVLENESRRAAVVALDVLAVSRGFADSLRTDLAEVLGTSHAAVLVGASHTHSGPRGLQNWFPVGEVPLLDSHLMEIIRQRVREAAQHALQSRLPVLISAASGTVIGIGGDRNQPEAAFDPRVSLLSFARPNGAPAAILFHYACHPTVLGLSNSLYSADFPGAARQRIRAQYPDTICLYLNGAAGNISTRFLRRAQTFEEVIRLGGILGERVLRLLPDANMIAPRLAWAEETIDLAVRSFPARSRFSDSTGNARLDRVKTEGLILESQLEKVFQGRGQISAALSGLAIGSWTLLAVPGEPFSDLAMAMRAVSPNALVIGYANDYLGYFPTPSAIEAYTYEALSSPYDSRAHLLLQLRLMTLVRKLQDDRGV